MVVAMAMVTKPGAHPMKKLAFALVLAFAVIGGAVAVSLVATNPAYADGNSNGGGH
jgi:hypothetical protein